MLESDLFRIVFGVLYGLLVAGYVPFGMYLYHRFLSGEEEFFEQATVASTVSYRLCIWALETMGDIHWFLGLLAFIPVFGVIVWGGFFYLALWPIMLPLELLVRYLRQCSSTRCHLLIA